jgi:ApaG protein
VDGVRIAAVQRRAQVGEQPTLEPGEVHEYQSYCVLRGPRGYMEGHYDFIRPEGSLFRVAVPRFLLRPTDDHPVSG